MTNDTVTTYLVHVTNYCDKEKMYFRIIKEHQLRSEPFNSQKNANVDQLTEVENLSFTNPNGTTKSDKKYQLELTLLGDELTGN